MENNFNILPSQEEKMREIKMYIPIKDIFSIFNDENFKNWSFSDLCKKKIKINDSNDTCSFKYFFDNLDWNKETTTRIFDLLCVCVDNNANIKIDIFKVDAFNRLALGLNSNIVSFSRISMNIPGTKLYFVINNNQIDKELFIYDKNVPNKSHGCEKYMQFNYETFIILCRFLIMMGKEELVKTESYRSLEEVISIFSPVKNERKINFYNILKNGRFDDSYFFLNNKDQIFKYDIFYLNKQDIKVFYEIIENLFKCPKYQVQNMIVKFINEKNINISYDERIENAINNLFRNQEDFNKLTFSELKSKFDEIINQFDIWDIDNVNLKSILFKSLYNNLNKKLSNKNNVLNIICRKEDLEIEKISMKIPGSLSCFTINNNRINKIETKDPDGIKCQFISKEFNNESLIILCKFLTMMRIESSKDHIHNDLKKLMILYVDDNEEFTFGNKKFTSDIKDNEKIDNSKRINFYNILNDTDDVCYLDKNDWEKFRIEKLKLTSDEIQMLKDNQEVKRISNQEKKINKTLNFSLFFLKFMKETKMKETKKNK